MKPLRILLSYDKNAENYRQGVMAAGGQAFLPDPNHISSEYDGLILSGGGDIHPGRYGEEICGSVQIAEDRDRLEFALLEAFVSAGKPVLGICRGCQLINVFFGGSLHQDLDTQALHTSHSAEDLVHQVLAEKGSFAHDLYGDCFSVNSHHHQGVRQLGKGLKLAMMSKEDSVVEGIEHESLPIFAVQWHPERMCAAHRREDTVDGLEIFHYFFNLCRAD